MYQNGVRAFAQFAHHGQENDRPQLPIYQVFWKLSTCVICDFETNGWIKKKLDNVLFKVKLFNHLWNGGGDGEISYMISSKSMQYTMDHVCIVDAPQAL